MWWFSLFVVISFVILEVVWIMLPLVSAIKIFRLFPETPVNASFTISGLVIPLSKLTVKAGGAFGAYLVAVLVMYPVTQRMLNEVHGLQRTIWTVTANAEFKDLNNYTLDLTSEDLTMKDALLKKLNLQTEPERFYHSTIELTFRIPEDNPGVFPKLLIVKDDQWKGAIGLKDECNNPITTTKCDWFEKTIEIKHPIIIQEIKKSGDYSSTTGMDRGS